MTAAKRASASVAAQMSGLPITPTHRRITIAIGVGLFFEMYEVFLAGTTSAVLTKEFHLQKAQLPVLLGSTFLGMFLGAILLGRLADRFGRRRAFLFNLGLYSFFTLLGAFSPNATFFVVTRFMAGVGVGAEFPVADVYLSDMLPARQRGRYSAWAYTCSFLAVPFIGFSSLALTSTAPFGISGWRWLLALGAVGALVIFLVRRGLPESPRWLESMGRQTEAQAVLAKFKSEAHVTSSEAADTTTEDTALAEKLPLRTLLTQPYKRRTLMLVVFHALQTVGYYGFGTLAPTVLVARGYPVASSLLFTALTFLGYPLGSLAALFLIEEVERKFLLIGSTLGMAVFGIAFGMSGSMVGILVFGFCFTLLSNIFSTTFHIYQAEIFPTSLRATATSWTYSLSRLSGGIMPFFLVPLLNAYGAAALFAVVAGALVVLALDVLMLGPRTSGRALESVNPIPRVT